MFTTFTEKLIMFLFDLTVHTVNKAVLNASVEGN